MKSKDFSYVVKVTNACNLACSYCYYRPTQNKQKCFLPISSIINLFEQVFDDENKESASFYWHGGEPLLQSIDYFEEIIKYQNKFNKNKIRVENTVQTNGTLLSKEWLDFFISKDFCIGISIDGPYELHNNSRKMKKHKNNVDSISSYKKIIDAIGYLNEKNAKYGVLSVITLFTLTKTSELFQFYVDNKIKNIGILPLVVLKNDNSINEKESISPNQFSTFFIEFYEKWLAHGDDSIIVREIDEFLKVVNKLPSNLCHFKNNCENYFTIQPDGNISLCDNLPLIPQFEFGNCQGNIENRILKSEKYKNLKDKLAARHKSCLSCEYYKYCNGGCSFERFIQDGKTFSSMNYFCSSYKKIFRYLEESLNYYHAL